MVICAYDSAHDVGLAAMVDRAEKIGAYRVHGPNGEFLDAGWFYDPLIALARDFGLEGNVHRELAAAEIVRNVRDSRFTIVSVDPKTVRGETSERGPANGGHLVLVWGVRFRPDGTIEGFFVHNPSARSSTELLVPASRFNAAFAGRGMSLWASSSVR
jgi:hypothetical protein